MNDNSGNPRGTPGQEPAGTPVPKIRGHASPEELSAVVAIVAVLAASGDGDDEETDQPPASGPGFRPAWSSPARMVRTTHPHGPGGWRASASPR
jgi:Acyl-CoA carboxylase epsilon subunit